MDATWEILTLNMMGPGLEIEGLPKRLTRSCLALGFDTLASNLITAGNLKRGKEMSRGKQECLRSSNKVEIRKYEGGQI